MNVTDSPTISITPPHSLDYAAPKAGWNSPNGCATPNGMVSSRSGATTVLLSPGYLQGPCQCNASIKVSYYFKAGLHMLDNAVPKVGWNSPNGCATTNRIVSSQSGATAIGNMHLEALTTWLLVQQFLSRSSCSLFL